MNRIAVLVSGGVDSSTALRILADEGHDVTAFYLKIWLEDEMAFMGSCPWEDDLRFVREVCDDLKVPLKIISLQREYFERVVDWTVAELRAGRTPSPDILCNERIKFGAFLERIDPRYTAVATGHHAQKKVVNDQHYLIRGVDPVKDQTYFLCQLSQQQLRRCLFPIGHLDKSEIRRLAREWGLANADRPDSQGICFLGRIPYPDFIAFHLGEQPGDIVERRSGMILGQHRGYWFHTIGQRRGLGLAGGPWYVVEKDVSQNRVLVEHREHLAEARQSSFRVTHPNWITRPPETDSLLIRIRHGPAIHPCSIHCGDDWVDIELTEPDSGIAPGQFAVLYDHEVCLGGGPISSSAGN